MKKVAFSIIICLFVTSAWAESISIKGGRIKFNTPEGFREMTQEEASQMYKGRNLPSKVYTNKDIDVTIAIIFGQAPLSMQLSELKSGLEETLPRVIPNLVWKKKEIITSNGTKWIHFELVSSAINADFCNDMYYTSFDGKLLGFNFNCVVEQYENYSTELKKSFESIRIDN